MTKCPKIQEWGRPTKKYIVLAMVQVEIDLEKYVILKESDILGIVEK